MGKIFWLFGLSGSGKSTVARELVNRLPGASTILDGDEIRMKKNIGFTREERTKHLLEVAAMASEKCREYDNVICSFITPYEEVRQKISQTVPGITWVWMKCPLETCEKRDVKGLYKKARAGEINHFTGISDPFDLPLLPHIEIDTFNFSISESLDTLITRLSPEQYQ